jgi:hypothetical protein
METCWALLTIFSSQAIVLASRNEAKYGTILRSTYTIVSLSKLLFLDMPMIVALFIFNSIVQVFVGCPHRSVSQATLSDSIENLIRIRNHRPEFGVLNTARLIAWSILETNDLFLGASILLQARLVCVYSEHLEYAKKVGWKDAFLD